MISTTLMIAVVVLLAVTLVAARWSRRRELRLERDNEAMQRELARHRETVQSILRELESS